MKLSTQEEYGLRCLIQIGRHEQIAGGSLSISEISQLEGLSIANAGKFVRALRLGGFVDSERGHSGGYRLARPVDQIVIGDVIEALGGRLFDDEFCEEHAGQAGSCTHTVDCSIRSLWHNVQKTVDQLLNQITLKDMLGDEPEVSANIGAKSDELLQVSSAH
jgi:Rrf2 family transcriptional regulator, iron-sulfur cluster assembly transcription factor